MKIKRTYHDEEKGHIVDADELKKYYAESGERQQWIDSVFSMLENGEAVSLRFCKLEPVSDNTDQMLEALREVFDSSPRNQQEAKLLEAMINREKSCVVSLDFFEGQWKAEVIPTQNPKS
jgi:hypothetical protein